jgi:hypothetical protein
MEERVQPRSSYDKISSMSHAAKTLTHRAWRHRHLAGLVCLIILLVWGSVWSFAAFQMGRILDHMIEQAAAKGLTFTYEKRYTNGTPFAVHAHLDPLTITMQNGNSLRADESVFYLDLWDWSAVSAKLRNGIDGKVMDQPFKAGIIKFGFEFPIEEPRNHTDTGLSLWLQPIGLDFEKEPPFALGNRMEEGFFRFRVMGPVPDFLDAKSLMAWNEASGLIEFDRFYLNWGPLTVTANGAISFDSKLRPEGAFSGRISGLDEAVGVLAAQGTMKDKQFALLRSALDVLSRPSSLTGSSDPIVPITLQGGSIYLGPVKLMDLPMINWQ